MLGSEYLTSPTTQSIIPELLSKTTPFACFSLQDGEYLLFKFANTTISVFVPRDQESSISQLKHSIPKENQYHFQNRSHDSCPVVSLELGAVADVNSFAAPSDPVGKPVMSLEGVVATIDQSKTTIELDARSVATLFRDLLPGELHDYNFMELRGPNNTLVIAFDTNKGIFILENSQKYPAATQLSELLVRLTNSLKTDAHAPAAANALLQAEVAVEQGWVDVSVPEGVQHATALANIYKYMYFLEVFFVALAAETKQDPQSIAQSREKLKLLLPFAAEAQQFIDAIANRARALQPDKSIVEKIQAWLTLRRANKAKPIKHMVGAAVWRRALPGQTKNILAQIESVEKPTPLNTKRTVIPSPTEEAPAPPQIVNDSVELSPLITGTPERNMGIVVIQELENILRSLDQNYLTLDRLSLLRILSRLERVADIAQNFIPKISPESLSLSTRRQQVSQVLLGIRSDGLITSDPLPSDPIWQAAASSIHGLPSRSVFSFENHKKGPATYQLIINEILQQIKVLVQFSTHFKKEPITTNLGTYLYNSRGSKQDPQFSTLARRLPQSLQTLKRENERPSHSRMQSINEVQIVQVAIQLHIAQLIMTFKSWGEFTGTMLGLDLKTWLETILSTQMQLDEALEPLISNTAHDLSQSIEPTTQLDTLKNIAFLSGSIPKANRIHEMGQVSTTYLFVLNQLRANILRLNNVHNKSNLQSVVDLDSEMQEKVFAALPPEVQRRFLLGKGYTHSVADELEIVTNRMKVLQNLKLEILVYRNPHFRPGEVITLPKISNLPGLAYEDRHLIEWLKLVLSDSHMDQISIPRFASALLQTIGLQLTTEWANQIAKKNILATAELDLFATRSLSFTETAIALA